MNLEFTPQQISDFPAKSDGLTRFIAGLTAEQARQCIDHELHHEKRNDVLALLASQIVAKAPTREIVPVDSALVRQGVSATLDIGPGAHAKILNTLQLSRAHGAVRAPHRSRYHPRPPGRALRSMVITQLDAEAYPDSPL